MTARKPRAPSLAERLRAELTAAQDRIDAAEASSARLERAMAHLVERHRSLSVLLERVEQDRDVALQRLSTAAYEASDWRVQLRAAREMLQRLATERESMVENVEIG